MSQRARARGHVRDLRARGVTFDSAGRARVGGRFISNRSLAARLAHLERPARKGPGLESQLRKQGIKQDTLDRTSPKEIAAFAGVSERTVRSWIDKGGASPYDVDAVAAGLLNKQILSSQWRHGIRDRATPGEVRELGRALRTFVRARSLDASDTRKKYERWRRMKDFVRGRLTRKAWEALLHRLGKGAGLSATGMFSVIRFIMS